MNGWMKGSEKKGSRNETKEFYEFLEKWTTEKMNQIKQTNENIKWNWEK